jgi:hypothetical protein
MTVVDLAYNRGPNFGARFVILAARELGRNAYRNVRGGDVKLTFQTL